MSKTRPFLSGSAPVSCEAPSGESVVALVAARLPPAISPPAKPPPPIPKPHAAATPAFTNSRRVVRPIVSPLPFLVPPRTLSVKFPLPPNPASPANRHRSLFPELVSGLLVLSSSLSQFVQINLRIPNLGRLYLLVPRNFPPGVGRRPRHHTRKRRLRPLRRLIVEIPAGNALDERLLLLRIREFQIRSELPRRRKPLLIFRWRQGCLPRFIP